jgi:hypothetical protein
MPARALSGSSDVETCPVFSLLLSHGVDLGLLGSEILLWTLISGAAWLAWASLRITRWVTEDLIIPGIYVLKQHLLAGTQDPRHHHYSP